VLRAVTMELVTSFAFLSLVALHAESECRDGWATRTVHGWLDPDRVPPWLGGLALLVVAARWVAWADARRWVVPWRGRARALVGALAGLATATLACGWLVGPDGPDVHPWSSGARPDLSLELLRFEVLGFALVAIGLATAPAGALVELARRPVHATLAGAALSLGSFFLMSWSCRADVGWGRAVLLGTGVGLGLALGGSRLAASPSRADPVPGRRWVLLALVASIGSPVRIWPILRQSVLGQLAVYDLAVYLGSVWILQALFACHLAGAWGCRRGPAAEVALSAGLALQLTTLVVQVVPAKVLPVVDPGALVVHPAAAFALTTWGLVTLGLFHLRSRARGLD
jgi:hypothetical protein